MLSLCEDCSLARIQTAAPHRHSLRHGKDKGVKGRSKLIAINSEPTGIKASSTSTTQTQKGDRGYGSQQSSQQDRRRVVNPTQATSTYLEVLIRITVAIEMTTHTYTVKGADHEKTPRCWQAKNTHTRFCHRSREQATGAVQQNCVRSFCSKPWPSAATHTIGEEGSGPARTRTRRGMGGRPSSKRTK